MQSRKDRCKTVNLPVQNKTNQIWELGYTMSNLQPTERSIREDEVKKNQHKHAMHRH